MISTPRNDNGESQVSPWLQRYESGDTPWDKGTPHPEIPRMLTYFPFQAKVWVPGCGCGHDAAALHRYGLHAIGCDISPIAIRRARTSYGENEKLRWMIADFFKVQDEIFDAVFEHTFFCAIDPGLRPTYYSKINSLLRPGGRLVGIFYIDPDHDHSPPFPIAADELDRLFDDWKLLAHWVPQETFSGREGRESVRIYEKP